jgi:CheY-like chemotaxis protein
MRKIDSLYVVDDDDIYQYLAQEVIKSTGLVERMKSFSNGHEAISFIESVKDNSEELPGIILLDLFMPVMDGWGFLEKFALLKPFLKKDITIYIVTSSIDPLDVQRAKSNYAVSDYLIKPLTHGKFIDSIKSLVQ